MSENGTDLKATADVSAQRLARVYAEAFLNAADKRGQGEDVLDELHSLITDVFQREPQLEVLLSSAAVGRKRREDIIQKVFAGKASEIFGNFLLVLNHHERLELLRPILVALRQLHDERARRIRVQVRSAVALPDDQKLRLEQELRQDFRLEPILEIKVEPELIGGLLVRVGDWQYDASVRTQLETIRNEILTGSSHEIQSRRDRFSTAE